MNLGKFKKLKVLITSAMVGKLNQRLSDTLLVQPRVIEVDETVFAIVRLAKTKDRFDYVEDAEGKVVGVEHVQIFEAKSAVLFDESDKDELMGNVLQKAVDLFIEAQALKHDGQLTMHFDDGRDDGEGEGKTK